MVVVCLACAYLAACYIWGVHLMLRLARTGPRGRFGLRCVTGPAVTRLHTEASKGPTQPVGQDRGGHRDAA